MANTIMTWVKLTHINNEKVLINPEDVHEVTAGQGGTIVWFKNNTYSTVKEDIDTVCAMLSGIHAVVDVESLVERFVTTLKRVSPNDFEAVQHMMSAARQCAESSGLACGYFVEASEDCAAGLANSDDFEVELFKVAARAVKSELDTW